MPKKVGDITLFTILELSKKLGITTATLRTYIKQGRIKGQKFGGKWYVSENSLKLFFEGLPEAPQDMRNIKG